MEGVLERTDQVAHAVTIMPYYMRGWARHTPSNQALPPLPPLVAVPNLTCRTLFARRAPKICSSQLYTFKTDPSPHFLATWPPLVLT